MRASVFSHGLVLPLPDAAAGPGGDSRLAEFEQMFHPATDRFAVSRVRTGDLSIVRTVKLYDSFDLTLLTRSQGHQFEPCSLRIRQWPDEVGGQHPFELR